MRIKGVIPAPAKNMWTFTRGHNIGSFLWVLYEPHFDENYVPVSVAVFSI